ncbi:3'(2'),5'-bisphosphate nucleotidase CysQ [Gymnodinialimonas sp. 2305UL16-5]|uniref:inositol monophosphatase family protein n=1 Tax=Gymnodinialimonas mytili TaxID=3126503 RepID=UPI003097BDDF
MPGPEHDDLALLIDAAHSAGEIARHYFRRDPQVWDKGVDDPVTEADLAIDTMLRETLLAARPNYGWLSEETEDSTARLSSEYVFICDPIDGTRAFIEGGKSFAHSLAVARGGQVTAAAIYLPVREKLYAAALGHGAELNGMPVSVRPAVALDQSEVLTTKPNMDPRHWPHGTPPVKRAYRPSLAYRMSLVGEGRFDAMMTFRPTWEWDIAAGALIIAEAGGAVSDGTGKALRFNNATPQVDGLIAGATDVHRDLVRLRGSA